MLQVNFKIYMSNGINCNLASIRKTAIISLSLCLINSDDNVVAVGDHVMSKLGNNGTVYSDASPKLGYK